MLVVQRLVFERVHIQSAKLNPLEVFYQKTVWVYLRHSGAVFLSPQVHLKLTEEIL